MRVLSIQTRLGNWLKRKPLVGCFRNVYNMIKTPLALLIAIAALTITTADANWVYLTPGFDWYGYRDAYGVTHAWQADAARYDSETEISKSRSTDAG